MAEMAHAEELLLKWLPKMRDAVHSAELKKAFEQYLPETQGQLEKVKTIFELHEVQSREKKCEAMLGLLSRAQQLMQRSGAGPALDAALISVARKVTAQTSASYEILAKWAKLLDDKKVVKTLEKISEVEEQASKRFQQLQANHDRDAFEQLLDSPRKTGRAVRKPGELVEKSSWNGW